MTTHTFAPGFRLSAVDVVVLIAGTIASIALATMTWWWGLAVGFVLGHFFLFCNVFRMARPLELAWAAVFVVLAGGTITHETPGWMATFGISVITTICVIAIELRKPSYHGIGWQRINPNLPQWWDAHVAQTAR